MSDTNEARIDPKEREQRLNDVREIVVIQLKRKQPTHTDVQKKVRSCLEDELPDYTQEELNRIVSEIEYSIRITVQEPDILVDKSSQTNWFKIAEPNTPTRYFFIIWSICKQFIECTLNLQSYEIFATLRIIR